jgi:hypothetical protein
MSEPAEIAVRTQRFTEAVRDFKLAAPSRHAKLMPLKDGIVELRQKGASLRLIRELLATVDVAVGSDTIIETISPPTCGRSGFHSCDAHHFSDTAARHLQSRCARARASTCRRGKPNSMKRWRRRRGIGPVTELRLKFTVHGSQGTAQALSTSSFASPECRKR